MNDRSAVTNEGCVRETFAGQPPGVGALEHGDARVLAQPPVQLPVADVDGDHARGAALQQAVDEAAGGAAQVDRVLAGHVDVQARERRVELVAAARDVAAARGGGERGAVVDLRAGLVDDAAVHGDLPREDGGSRLGAGGEEAAVREQHVQPLAHRRPT